MFECIIIVFFKTNKDKIVKISCNNDLNVNEINFRQSLVVYFEQNLLSALAVALKVVSNTYIDTLL